MEHIDVIWKNEIVGSLEDVVPDMSYLDGRFVAADSAAAREFVTRASALDARLVMKEPAKGIRASIAFGHGRTVTVIFSLKNGMLCLRRVHDPKGVAWVEANVTE